MYMHAKFGTSYHWIPELYRRLKLPVFDVVQVALEKHRVQRKRKLDRKKMTPVKKRRIVKMSSDPRCAPFSHLDSAESCTVVPKRHYA